MKIKYYIFLLFIVAAFSCRKEIAFDADLIAPKLVINSFITHDSIVKIDVAVSKTIPGVESPQKWLDDATVVLYENDNEIATLEYVELDIDEDELDFYYGNHNYQDYLHGSYWAPQVEIKTGNSYQVKVTHPDYDLADAETFIPEPVAINSIAVTSEKDDSDYWSGSTFNYKIKFKDTPDVENYYRVYLQYSYGRKMEDWDTEDPYDSVIYVENFVESYYLGSNDPLLNPEDDANDILFGSPSNRYNLFTDNVIDGKEYELSFYTSYYNDQPNGDNWLEKEGEFFHAKVFLVSLTREAFLYFKSSYEQGWYDGDIFAEPVQAYSNINNGIGIFAGYSIATATFKKGEYPVDGIDYRGNTEGYGGYFKY